jgi:MoaA/NifB/PqqE/SkfB family radical SAM enzyme
MSGRETKESVSRAAQTTCALPWTHLFVSTLGTLATCCVGDLRPSADAAGVTIRAGQPDAIRRHWLSQRMRGVRTDLASGRRSAGCNNCWLVERSGGVSNRHRAADMNFEPYDESIDDPPPRIQFVDLRLGNFCNLKCRMCAPHSSRLLIPEYRELQKADEIHWDNLADISWFDNDMFWQDLLQYAPHFRRVHLAGGEPMVIAKAWDFLRRLTELGFSQNIELTYNSNWTVIPKWTAEVWRAFKSVDVFISMDGVGEVNEFIRRPLKWDVFRENLALVEERHEEFNIRSASIHATAQVYNVMHLPELCAFVRSLDFINPYPHIAIAMYPEVFDPRVLPGDLKQEARHRIQDYIDDLGEPDAALLRRYLGAVTSHMLSADHSHLLPALRRHNEVFDRHRGERAADIFPELASIFA